MRNIKIPRKTKQQQVVLQTLRSTVSHPTADELFIEVRRYLPRVSLATVYRNLSKLESEGKIQSLELGSGQRRYDGNSAAHFHVRCRSCNRVADLKTTDSTDLFVKKAISTMGHSDFLIEDCNLELIGLCDNCQSKS